MRSAGIAGDMFVAALLDALPELRERVLADAAAVLPAEAGRPALKPGMSSGMRCLRFGLEHERPGHAARSAGHATAAHRQRRGHFRPDMRDADRGGARSRRAPRRNSRRHSPTISPRPRPHIHGVAVERRAFPRDRRLGFAHGRGRRRQHRGGAARRALERLRPAARRRPREDAARAPAGAGAGDRGDPRGFRWRDDGVGGERVTPTGAAILRHLVGAGRRRAEQRTAARERHRGRHARLSPASRTSCARSCSNGRGRPAGRKRRSGARRHRLLRYRRHDRRGDRRRRRPPARSVPGVLDLAVLDPRPARRAGRSRSSGCWCGPAARESRDRRTASPRPRPSASAGTRCSGHPAAPQAIVRDVEGSIGAGEGGRAAGPASEPQGRERRSRRAAEGLAGSAARVKRRARAKWTEAMTRPPRPPEPRRGVREGRLRNALDATRRSPSPSAAASTA